MGWGGRGTCRPDTPDYPACLIGLHEVMAPDAPPYVFTS
jgi:hypothetical protein